MTRAYTFHDGKLTSPALRALNLLGGGLGKVGLRPSLDPDKLEEVKECRQLMHDVLSNDPADRGKPDPWIARLHGKGWTHVGGK